MCFPVSTYKSQCFKEFYDLILDPGLDCPGFNRMGLNKDMRNDNLFFKRVTDIIKPLAIHYLLTCKNVQISKSQVLTSFSPEEKLSINCDCSRKPQCLSPCARMITIELVSVVKYKLLK